MFFNQEQSSFQDFQSQAKPYERKFHPTHLLYLGLIIFFGLNYFNPQEAFQSFFDLFAFLIVVFNFLIILVCFGNDEKVATTIAKDLVEKNTARQNKILNSRFLTSTVFSITFFIKTLCLVLFYQSASYGSFSILMIAMLIESFKISSIDTLIDQKIGEIFSKKKE